MNSNYAWTVSFQKLSNSLFINHPNIRHSIVAYKAVSWQRLGEHIPVATDTHATIEILLETVFSTRSVQRSYQAN
jgi:hypothetical protein